MAGVLRPSVFPTLYQNIPYDVRSMDSDGNWFRAGAMAAPETGYETITRRFPGQAMQRPQRPGRPLTAPVPMRQGQPMQAPVRPIVGRSQQGRQVQYDANGQPFISEITQPADFNLSPPVAPVGAPFIPTVENPATDEQVAQAFYGPNASGLPPEMTQQQYLDRKAAGFPPTRVVQGGGIGMVAGFPRPMQAMGRKMSKQEIAAMQRLLETTGNQNPAQRRGVRIDGEIYQPLGRPGYGDANRYQGRLSDETVGLGAQTGGLGTTGGMGSSLMRGRMGSFEDPQANRLAWATAREAEREARMNADTGNVGMIGGERVREGEFQDAWDRYQAARRAGALGNAGQFVAANAPSAMPVPVQTEPVVPVAPSPLSAPGSIDDRPSVWGGRSRQAIMPGATGTQVTYRNPDGSLEIVNQPIVAGTPRSVNIPRAGRATPSAYLPKPKPPSNPITGTVSAPPELYHSPMVTPGIGAPPIPTGTGPYAGVATPPLGLPAPSGGMPPYYQPPQPYPNFTLPGQPGYGMIPAPGSPVAGPPIPTATGPYARVVPGTPPPPAPMGGVGIPTGQQGMTNSLPAGTYGGPGQQAPVRRPGGPVGGQATAAAVPAAGAAAAPTAPVTPQPGFMRRAAPYALGVGGVVGAGGYLASRGEAIPQLPVGPGEEQVYRSKAFGETTDPVAAQNRMLWDAEVARRKAGVQARGIAKGERRDLRMGNASPELVARAQMANNPNVMAAMYAAQQEAVARGAEPALLSQLGQYNTDMTNLQQQWIAATPEERPAIEERMRQRQSIPFSTPQGQSPQQFMQGTLGSPLAAPVQSGTSTYVRPITSPVAPVQATEDTGPVPGGSGLSEKPNTPEETPPPGMTREQFAKWSEEQKKRGKDLADYERKVSIIKSGRIPWEPGDMRVAESGTPEQAARIFVELYGEYGLTYEQALKNINEYRRGVEQGSANFWSGMGST